jgi:hypothetical protein
VLDKPITLRAVQITALAHRLKEGILLHRLSVSGLLTRELAAELGCQDLVFLDNGTPKHGFTKFDLDVECGAFRASFEADPDLKQRFELTGDSCESFVVKRTDNGLFQLSWRMNYHGDPHPALAYLEAVGGGDAALRIVPLDQQQLFADAQASDLSDKEVASWLQVMLKSFDGDQKGIANGGL